jgi:hypothetical protein
MDNNGQQWATMLFHVVLVTSGEQGLKHTGDPTNTNFAKWRSFPY